MTVVDVAQGKLVPDQRVVIAGTRIQAVGQRGAVPLPRSARVISAAGQYLIPGLWDVHTHPARSTDVFYPMFLANGVTGIRDAGSPVPLDTLRLWQREIMVGARVGPPRQILSTKALDTCTGTAASTDSHHCIATLADVRPYVEAAKASGVDMLKMYTLTPAMYFALAAEARRVGLPFGGHADQVTAVEASDSGARIVDHLRLEDDWPSPPGFYEHCVSPETASVAQCRPIAERLKRNGTWMVADLRLSPGPAVFPQEDVWPPTDGPLPSGKTSDDSVGLMHMIQQVGLPILAGTDVAGRSGQVTALRLYQWWGSDPPGFYLHAVLAQYVAEGLTPLHALQSATLNPAQMWHATDSLGTVAAGKLADLVLLDANPLKDITNTQRIRAVVANGRYYDRAALDGVLNEVHAKIQTEPTP